LSAFVRAAALAWWLFGVYAALVGEGDRHRFGLFSLLSQLMTICHRPSWPHAAAPSRPW